VPQRRIRRDALERVARVIAERAAGRGQDQPLDLVRLPSMQALVNRVVLAVHRQDRHAAAAGRLRHERAGHHQHFLVRERNRLPRFDRREHRFQSRRP